MISREDVQKLANLSRIQMTSEEETAFATEIDSILGYVAQVTQLPAGIESELSSVRNIFRADENPHESGLYTDAIVAQMPSKEGNSLKVKKIIAHD